MPQINLAAVAACTGATTNQAMLYAQPLAQAMAAYGISQSPARAAMFLGNVAHESGRLQHAVESLNYSVDALLLSFGRHRISEDDARRYGRTAERPADQVAIANCIYGGAWGVKNLGNTEDGDGALFIGRGLIQVTGRANYAAMQAELREKMGSDVLLADPKELELPAMAAWSAAAFWAMRDLNACADRGDFDGVCDVINRGRTTAAVGDSNGFKERQARYLAALNYLSRTTTA